MNHRDRLQRALDSLLGLALGDAFGDRTIVNNLDVNAETTRRTFDATVRPQPWRYTDDTQMALSIVENLARFGEIQQNELAHSFADHYENWRGYAPAMHGMLQNIRDNSDWHTVSRGLFNNSGSFGNDGAKRVAPLGAYFWDNPIEAAAQARLSAEVTHAHPEGIAGAVAVAVAAGQFAELSHLKLHETLDANEFLAFITPHLSSSEVRHGIEHAMRLGPEISVEEAAAKLGNGTRISAQDTVPFCLWCVARHRDSYEEALWSAVSGGGDRDTNCAIVGGILAAGLPRDYIPAAWRQVIEPWPFWFNSALSSAAE